MTTATANTSRPADVSGFVDRVVRPLTKVLNPLILRVAGGWWFPIFSVLHHRGHKTGRMYTSPVSAMPASGFFWLSLAFGESAGWVRNLMAAGEADLRYRGTDFHLVEAALIDVAEVTSQLPPVMRIGMKVLGAHKVIRMRPTANKETRA